MVPSNCITHSLHAPSLDTVAKNGMHSTAPALLRSQPHQRCWAAAANLPSGVGTCRANQVILLLTIYICTNLENNMVSFMLA